MILKGYLFSVLYALVCLALAFACYKLGTPKKITRKIVHILVGFEWVILYHFFGPGIHFLSVCLLFTLVLFVTHRRNLMPMISSEGDNAPGTVYYGIAMTVMATLSLFVPGMIVPFGIGVVCTSLGDGLAGVVGQCIRGRANPKIYGSKSLLGSLTNFAACLAGTFLVSSFFALGLSVWQCLAVAAFATELELFTVRGLDNITITLGSSLLSYAFAYFDGAGNYILPILATPLIIALAHSGKALTRGGIISAVILDLAISVSLGNFGFAILFAFFAIGVAIDKIKKRYNKTKQNIESKGSCRDYIQVLSNGSVPAICAVLYFATSNFAFLMAFVASLAEALADTAASGIGSFSRRTFDPFRMKPIAKGLSGGMSVVGTLASLIGALVIALLAMHKIGLEASLVVVLSAFLGALFDSLLGSLLQVKYRCTVCGDIVERKSHCESQTVKHSGISFITNDTVNLLGTLFSAIVAMLIYII